MSLTSIAEKVIETDVLIVGGGIGGTLAAAKAAEHGLRVTLIEKSKTDRSGSTGHGIDHYGIFPNGVSTLECLRKYQEEFLNFAQGPGVWVDPNVDFVQFDKAFWALDELEKLGVPMKWDDGKYYWFPMMIRDPGVKVGLRVHWQNFKPIMASVVKKRGVNVLDRVMIVDLLTNKGKVMGATTINTRTGEFEVIKAKAVIMATGMFCRCYNPETPLFWKYKFRYHYCPATTSGDGWASAYRAGAGLSHMDISGWGLRIRDDITMSMGSFGHNDGLPSHVYNSKGEEPNFSNGQYRGYNEQEEKGLGPLYQSLEHLPDDFHKRLEMSIVDEWMIVLKMAEDRGFNPKTHRYEFMLNKPLQFMNVQGIQVDDEFKSPFLKGLYAVGDCAAGVGGCQGAAVAGLLVGDRINKYISETSSPEIDENQLESQKQVALAPLSVKDGTEPLELECAIRHVCERYIGNFKYEGRLMEGKRRLETLKREFMPKLMAKNPHYLMRCLEVRNIMDLAELHLIASLERKETRGNFIRNDYPERDPVMDTKFTCQRLKDGKPILERLEMPKLKPEFAKGEK